MNRAIKERKRAFNIGTQSSHYISILLYIVYNKKKKKKSVGKWKCKGTIRQLSCIKEIQLQLMSTWWALFLALYIFFSIQVVRSTWQHSYWLIQALYYIINNRWETIFWFFFKSRNRNLINYLEISWKITFAHPKRTEHTIYYNVVNLSLYFSVLFILFFHTYFLRVWTNKYGQKFVVNSHEIVKRQTLPILKICCRKKVWIDLEQNISYD